MTRLFCYFRVSAGRLNRQGLYLESQQRAVTDYLSEGLFTVAGEVFELEKVGLKDRPALDEAIEQCRRQNATLLIAKIGTQLSNPDFLERLVGADIDVRACDCSLLTADNLEPLLQAAHFRRNQIGARIRLGLQAARVRGATFGSPGNLSQDAAARGRVRGASCRKSAADRFTRRFYPKIAALMAAGMSMTAVARHFNQEKVPTATGKIGGWNCSTVRNVLARGEKIGLG